MPISVVMPALEMSQDTGKVVAWHKKEGEYVNKGEILLEVETDKATVEVEAQADGSLAGVSAQPGDVIPVGQTIAWILGPGEAVPIEAVPIPSAAASARNQTVSVPTGAQVDAKGGAGAGRVKISPKARRIAQERGVDIGRVRGSGTDGEILVSDVLAASQSEASVPPTTADANPSSSAVDKQSLHASNSIHQLMAERTTQAWTTVPHFFVGREIDASSLIETRERLSKSISESRGVKLTHTDLLISVIARALEKHPRLNAQWTGKAVRPNEEINVGIAMAVEDGVVTGVVPGANKIEIGEIALLRREISERARSGRLRPKDITGATFTISNLGMYQVDAFTAIIVPPQAAILAVGKIADRVIAVEGKPAVRPMISLTLSCDHRVVDGARAAEFMQTVAAGMQRSDI